MQVAFQIAIYDLRIFHVRHSKRKMVLERAFFWIGLPLLTVFLPRSRRSQNAPTLSLLLGSLFISCRTAPRAQVVVQLVDIIADVNHRTNSLGSTNGESLRHHKDDRVSAEDQFFIFTRSVFQSVASLMLVDDVWL